MTTQKQKKLDMACHALEDAWVMIYRFAGSCWDVLDDLEEAIGAITGETDVQVNQRLHAANKRFLAGTNPNEKNRQRVRADCKRYYVALLTIQNIMGTGPLKSEQEQITEIVHAVLHVDPPKEQSSESPS